MASLLIEHVDDMLRTQLARRARDHRRTLEEEVLATLRAAVSNDLDATTTGADIVATFTHYFGPENGIDLDLPPRSLDMERALPDFSGPEWEEE